MLITNICASMSKHYRTKTLVDHNTLIACLVTGSVCSQPISLQREITIHLFDGCGRLPRPIAPEGVVHIKYIFRSRLCQPAKRATHHPVSTVTAGRDPGHLSRHRDGGVSASAPVGIMPTGGKIDPICAKLRERAPRFTCVPWPGLARPARFRDANPSKVARSRAKPV